MPAPTNSRVIPIPFWFALIMPASKRNRRSIPATYQTVVLPVSLVSSARK